MSICIEAIVLEYSCLGFAFEFTAPEHSRLFDLMAVDACSRQVLAVTWLHSRLRQVTRVTMQFLDFMHLMVQVALLGFGAILPFLCPRGHGTVIDGLPGLDLPARDLQSSSFAAYFVRLVSGLHL